MANAQLANKIYVDTTGTLTQKRTLVSYLIVTAHSAHTELILREEAGGQIALLIDVKDQHDTRLFDFSRSPLVFGNGIHATITAGSHATLIVTSAGGN